jgi:GDP-L-fucose synthase
MELLITGGTGLVGNALQKICPDAIYLNSKDFDLTKENKVKAMFKKYKPSKVIHLAARVGGIIDNIDHPAEFIYNNTIINTFVIHYAYKYKVVKLIGLLSNCAYPDKVEKYPMTEDQLYDGPPAISNFSYAYSKRLLCTQIQAYRSQYGCHFFSVIPCNLYGPHDKFDNKKSHFLAALIRKIYASKKNNINVIKLLGTGRPLRQYLYSEDLAKILLLLLEKYEGEGPINIAPQENPSIAQIAKIALDATSSSGIELKFDESFPDGQYRKDISNDRLLGLIGDYKFTPLREGVRKTYEWYSKNMEADL